MYQAFVILDSDRQLAAEPRLYQRDACADADRMHQERDSKRRVIVLDQNDKVVYDLEAD